MAKPLPIVWYVDDSQLPAGVSRNGKIKRIAKAVTKWEADGDKTLDDLRAEIDAIL